MRSLIHLYNYSSMGKSGYFEAGRLEQASVRKAAQATLLPAYAICLLQSANDTLPPELVFFSSINTDEEKVLRQNRHGYYCLVIKASFTEKMQDKLNRLAMFNSERPSCWPLTQLQALRMEELFARMIREIDTDYIYKPDLLKTYFIEFIHFALKMKSVPSKNYSTMSTTPFYVGMWVTKDGFIRHELLSNGRYDEARGNRNSAYQGRYTMTGNHIDYMDDTGFTADGDFRDGILYHAGMILYKES